MTQMMMSRNNVQILVGARHRADSSSVARLFVADLEPASLREREREKLQGVGSR